MFEMSRPSFFKRRSDTTNHLGTHNMSTTGLVTFNVSFPQSVQVSALRSVSAVLVSVYISHDSADSRNLATCIRVEKVRSEPDPN